MITSYFEMLGKNSQANERTLDCFGHLFSRHYTGGKNVWSDRPFYWACDFHDDATSLSFQLQVDEDFF
jgi:hypothetical protein